MLFCSLCITKFPEVHHLLIIKQEMMLEVRGIQSALQNDQRVKAFEMQPIKPYGCFFHSPIACRFCFPGSWRFYLELVSTVHGLSPVFNGEHPDYFIVQSTPSVIRKLKPEAALALQKKLASQHCRPYRQYTILYIFFLVCRCTPDTPCATSKPCTHYTVPHLYFLPLCKTVSMLNVQSSFCALY